MRPIGELFTLKARYEELKEELVPSFSSVIKSWIGYPIPTKFRDPEYVYSITYRTEPLKMFVRNISEALKIGKPSGGPLKRGFGFGKTHAMIFLWHVFNTNVATKHQRELEELGITDELVKTTLTIGIDFTEATPLTTLIEELQTYSKPTHQIAEVKDGRLIRAASQTLSQAKTLGPAIPSYQLANLITTILKKYRELGGRPRLLLLIDELGYGISLKLKRYCEEAEKSTGRGREHYNEIARLLDFLSHLYAELDRASIPSTIIWAIADQDMKTIEALMDRYYDNERLRRAVKSVIDELGVLAERYQRGAGGMGVAAFSYSPKHAVEIAKFRTLEAVEGVDIEDASNEFVRGLSTIAAKINIIEEFEAKKHLMKSYYPFSPGLIALMMKLMTPEDVPATEYVRTLISIAAKAAERALTVDPTGTYTIGIKHLTLPEIANVEMLKEIGPSWIEFLTGIEQAVEATPEDLREAAEHISKMLAAKGITAILPILIEAKDREALKRYAINMDELQLDILTSYPTSEALDLIEKAPEALNRLKALSGRIDEVEIGGVKHYLPTVLRTVYARLASLIIDEQAKVKELKDAPFYVGRSVIRTLFSQLKLEVGGHPVTMLMKNLSEITGTNIATDSDIAAAQRAGQLTTVIVPPWDLTLFEEIYGKGVSYEKIVERIKEELNELTISGKIIYPLHIIVLIPNVSEAKLSSLLNRLTVYEATKRFINYIRKHEKVIEEYVSEAQKIISKRLATLPEYDKISRKIQRTLREKVNKQIIDAKNTAQRQIITLSRELVAETVKLYGKVVYFSLDEKSFEIMDVAAIHKRTEEEVRRREERAIDLSKYAPIMNKFFEDIIKIIGFTYDASDIANKVREAYRSEFERGVFREEDRIDDVIENLMSGVYDVRPLNKEVAHSSLKLLSHTTIDLEDKIVRIHVDEQQGTITFTVERKALPPPEAIPPTPPTPEFPVPPPIPTLRELSLSIPRAPNITDLTTKLSETLTSLEGLIEKIVIRIREVRGARISAKVEVSEVGSKDSRNIGGMIRYFDNLTRNYGGRLAVELTFKKPVELDRIKSILGDYVPKEAAKLET